MLKMKLQHFGHLMQKADSFEKTLMLGKIEGGRRKDERGWDGWMASPTKWTWVWVNCGSWWWAGRPGVLQSMRLQRVGPDWATELNWWPRELTVQPYRRKILPYPTNAKLGHMICLGQWNTSYTCHIKACTLRAIDGFVIPFSHSHENVLCFIEAAPSPCVLEWWLLEQSCSHPTADIMINEKETFGGAACYRSMIQRESWLIHKAWHKAWV